MAHLARVAAVVIAIVSHRGRALISMPLDSLVWIALALNFALAIVAYSVPRYRNRRGREAMLATARSTAAAELAATRSRPAGDAAAIGAGAPWFSDGRPTAYASAGSTMAAPASDPATGLDTGQGWARWLNEEQARIHRFHRPSTIVLVELSGLERLADRLGNEAAQRLLPPIATTMKREARAADHLARLGPTRFGAMLVETDEVRAINFVERVRSACDVWLEAGAVMLRLSFGWAEISPDSPADVALLEAERRLFEERQRIASMLSRQADEPDVEAAMLEAAKA
jgi:diguanylate cyclase (GGDEF)-like protein